jgi:hypothetical protein
MQLLGVAQKPVKLSIKAGKDLYRANDGLLGFMGSREHWIASLPLKYEGIDRN